jgi:hypothetical protein
MYRFAVCNLRRTAGTANSYSECMILAIVILEGMIAPGLGELTNLRNSDEVTKLKCRFWLTILVADRQPFGQTTPSNLACRSGRMTSIMML